MAYRRAHSVRSYYRSDGTYVSSHDRGSSYASSRSSGSCSSYDPFNQSASELWETFKRHLWVWVPLFFLNLIQNIDDVKWGVFGFIVYVIFVSTSASTGITLLKYINAKEREAHIAAYKKAKEESDARAAGE